MADRTWTLDQNRTKENNIVIPLDEVRSYDTGHLAITSGAYPGSGLIYTVASGKEAYIRQIMIQETDDVAGDIQIAKVVSGGYSALTPPISLIGGQTKTIDTPPFGPATSGLTIISGQATTSFDVTLIVQVDPKAAE